MTAAVLSSAEEGGWTDHRQQTAEGRTGGSLTLPLGAAAGGPSRPKEERMSRTILRRLLVVGAAVCVGVLGQAVPAFGADTITPSVVTTTLQAGASTNVSKTLHLDGLPPRADIIVAVDTTGSMGTPIAQAQADAVN